MFPLAVTAALPAKTIVVYFSQPEDVELPPGVDAVSGASLVASGGQRLGSCEYLAKVIQEEIGADLFRIETANPYPREHQALTEFVREEQLRGEFPALAGKVKDIASYDTVILCYPIWWYALPLPVAAFLEAHQLDGVTIHLAVVHGGSRLCGTDTEVARLEQNAVVGTRPLVISRTDIAGSGRRIAEWARSIRE